MTDESPESDRSTADSEEEIYYPDHPTEPVARPLTAKDKPYQTTIWDRPSNQDRPNPGRSELYIQDGPERKPPERPVLWRLVEYRCRSCHSSCLVDHAERAAKYRECRDCARVPELDQEIRDHRLTSLLWAHLAAHDSTARTGEVTSVLPAPSAPRRGSEEPTGSDPSRVDPEAGPHRGISDSEEREKPQRRLSDSLAADGGESE